MIKVSIITPIYNAEKDLHMCIDSIIKQTYSNWELWLVNDGSTDESKKICDEYSKIDNRINVIHKENAGVSKARNCGLTRATGDYILFLDSDDYIDSKAIDILVKKAIETSADIVICGFYYHNIKTNKLVENLPICSFSGNNYDFIKACFSQVFQGELLNPPWNKLIARKVIEDNQIEFNVNYSICEDMIFSIQIMSACKKIVIIQEALYHYMYKQDGNLVYKFHKNFFLALSTYYKEIKNYFMRFNSDEKLYEQIDIFFVRTTIAYIKKIYILSGYKSKRKYQELCSICNDSIFREAIYKLRDCDIKKKVIVYCIKKRFYFILHILYLLIN